MIQDTAPSERIIIIRPSFKKMCDGNACRAAVFNHMLYWIAYKQQKNSENYWYATGEELYKQMDEAWSINIVRREVKALIASGLIGEMHNPKWAADRTKHFFFGKDQAQAFFTACTTHSTCPWCIGLPTIILHMLTTHLTDLLNANDISVKCICQKHHMQLLNLLNGSNRSVTAITKESTKETSKNLLRETFEEKIDSLVASASAESDGAATFLSSLSQFEETLKEVQQNGSANTDVARLVHPDDHLIDGSSNNLHTHQAQQIDGKAPLSVSPHKREGHSQEEPVVKSADTSLSSGAAHTSTPNDITSQEEVLQEIPTQGALTNAVPVTTPTKTLPTHKTVGKGKSKIPDPVPLSSPRTIREAIDAIRGYSLEEVGAIIHQNKVLKEWCQKHTLEEYQFVIDHVTKGHCTNKEHQFWREGTNFASFFNADKLAKLTPGILAELGYIPKPTAPPEVAPKEEKIIGWQPQRRITPPTGVTVIYA